MPCCTSLFTARVGNFATSKKRLQMADSTTEEKKKEKSEAEATDQLLQRLVVLGSNALVTRLLVGGVGALAMLVGGYYFLVDRTLRPLEERVASLEITANSRMLSLEEGLRAQSGTLSRIETKINGLNASLESLEASFGADVLELKAGAAQSIQEQRDLFASVARLEAKIEAIKDISFDSDVPLNLPEWPEVFPSIDLEQWVIDVSGSRAGSSLVAFRIPQEREVVESLVNFDEIVRLCGGGISQMAGLSSTDQIAYAYSRSDAEGDSFVFQNQNEIFSGTAPSERNALLKVFTDCVKTVANSRQADHRSLGYPEPTEKEMLGALQDLLGGSYDESTRAFVVQNPISGILMTIDQFRKHQCRVSTTGVGYDCTYAIKVGIKFFSNEDTDDGKDHAQAVNTLLGFMTRGDNRPAEITKRRFFKTGDNWFASEG